MEGTGHPPPYFRVHEAWCHSDDQDAATLLECVRERLHGRLGHVVGRTVRAHDRVSVLGIMTACPSLRSRIAGRTNCASQCGLKAFTVMRRVSSAGLVPTTGCPRLAARD